MSLYTSALANRTVRPMVVGGVPILPSTAGEPVAVRVHPPRARTAPANRWRHQCEALIRQRNHVAEVVECRQTVAVAIWLDAAGVVRGACRRDGHRYSVMRRFGLWKEPGEMVT